MQNLNDQITQSQSVGLLPMPRSGSRLETINDNQGSILANQENKNNQAITGSLVFGNQNFVKPGAGGGPGAGSSATQNNRAGFGRGLGGVGGSIISSSGINQNFKDYSSGAVTGPNNGLSQNNDYSQSANKGGNSSSAIPILKPSNITPAPHNQFS